MLAYNLGHGTTKRAVSCEPFIDNYSQCILIAGTAWLAQDLLWSHIRHCPIDPLDTQVAGTLRNQSNTKVAE